MKASEQMRESVNVKLLKSYTMIVVLANACVICNIVFPRLWDSGAITGAVIFGVIDVLCHLGIAIPLWDTYVLRKVRRELEDEAAYREAEELRLLESTVELECIRAWKDEWNDELDNTNPKNNE
jgi:hypothetical protein